MDRDELVAAIASTIATVAGSAPVRIVVVAIPSFVMDDGTFGPSPALPSLTGARLGVLLAERTGADAVTLVPDSAAAALGEAHHGAGRDSSRFLCAVLGTGANAGAVVDGQLVTTAFGCLGDAGHVVVGARRPAVRVRGRRLPGGDLLRRSAGRRGRRSGWVAPATWSTPLVPAIRTADGWWHERGRRWAGPSRRGACCCGRTPSRWPVAWPRRASSCSVRREPSWRGWRRPTSARRSPLSLLNSKRVPPSPGAVCAGGPTPRRHVTAARWLHQQVFGSRRAVARSEPNPLEVFGSCDGC